MADSDQPTLPSTGPGTRPLELDELLGRTLAGRFELRSVLGFGRHGTVFEAQDLRLGHRVALKVLVEIDADTVSRFKREFRALADVEHPNLVTLYELFVDAEAAFFTMELIDGGDVLSFVRGEQGVDQARLRTALVELTRGLGALHARGVLHRDLKPSNVLVRQDGSVALVDFGLVREVTAGADEAGTVGTPRYMSPEQAANYVLTPASDWYSVGVMLHEALVGAPPFEGLDGFALLMAKQVGDAQPIGELSPSGTPELQALCDALLDRQPPRRPGGKEVLRRLGVEPGRNSATSPADEQFFGRTAELSRLGALMRRLDPFGEQGHGAVAFVHGASGTGKSALVRRFAQRVRLRGAALVLEGRCHERETVPFKGIDDLVDALRRHLHALVREGDALPPPLGAHALTQLFPVLADVPGFSDGDLGSGTQDPVARRDQAVVALRELLARLAEQEPLLLVLDDLQWCDPDSTHVLVELFGGSSRPRALLLGCYRDEDERGGVVSQRLQARARPGAGELQVEDIPIGPLDDGDTQALATAWLAGRDDARALAEIVARESEGHPLFAAELARHISTLPREAEVPARLQLGAVIQARVAGLPAVARHLLEAVVVAGHPVQQRVVLDACGEQERRPEALALLRSHCFVRTGGVDPGDPVEVYHDRIAAAVGGVLAPPDRRRWHGRLVDALLQHGAQDDVLAVHYEGQGEIETAAEHYTAGARRAAETLAFNRAASLYQAALRTVSTTHPKRGRLMAARADALANAGRGAEAGRAYLEAADLASPERVLELRRRAAEQLLRSGRIDEGLVQLRTVLAEGGLRSPPSPRRALARFLWQRLRIRLRGTRFRERRAEQVPPDLLLKVDICWSAATGLIPVNFIVGQSYQAQHLLLALEAGEPRRVARALAVETLYAATAGDAGVEVTARRLAQVEAFAGRLDDPRTQALAQMAAGAAALYRGRFGEALPRLARAETALRTRCSDVAWELSMVRTFMVMSLYYTGQLREMAVTMERSLTDAAARDDLHTALMLRVSHGPIEYLAADAVEDARAELDECRAQWPDQLSRSTFLYVEMLTGSRIERYAGQGEASWRVFEDRWEAIERSLMLERSPFRIFMLHDKACAATLAAHQGEGEMRATRLRQASALAERLTREKGPWGPAMAGPIEASIQAAQGHLEQAAATLTRTIAAFEPLGMHLYAHATRRRRGELGLGDHAQDEITTADEAMRSEDVADPARMAGMLVPPVLGWSREAQSPDGPQ